MKEQEKRKLRKGFKKTWQNLKETAENKSVKSVTLDPSAFTFEVTKTIKKEK